MQQKIGNGSTCQHDIDKRAHCTGNTETCAAGHQN